MDRLYSSQTILIFHTLSLQQEMRKALSILLIFVLGVTYTGAEICVDFCSDQIESIHFFGDDDDACHEKACCDTKEDCCESSHLDIEQQLLNYVLTSVESISVFVIDLPYQSDFHDPTVSPSEFVMDLDEGPLERRLDPQVLLQTFRC